MHGDVQRILDRQQEGALDGQRGAVAAQVVSGATSVTLELRQLVLEVPQMPVYGGAADHGCGLTAGETACPNLPSRMRA